MYKYYQILWYTTFLKILIQTNNQWYRSTAHILFQQVRKLSQHGVG